MEALLDSSKQMLAASGQSSGLQEATSIYAKRLAWEIQKQAAAEKENQGNGNKEAREEELHQLSLMQEVIKVETMMDNCKMDFNFEGKMCALSLASKDRLKK